MRSRWSSGWSWRAAAPTLRRRLAGNWPALPAAAIAFAGLLPSLPETSAPNPLPALAGLLGGVGLLVLADRRPQLTAPAIGIGLVLTLLSRPRRPPCPRSTTPG